MAVDLSVDFCGVKFKNPFILSASTASRVRALDKAAKAGWAGAVTWTGEIFSDRPVGDDFGKHQYTLARGNKYIDRPPALWSFESSDSVGPSPEYPYPYKRVEMVVAKSKQFGLPIIASIFGFNEDQYARASIGAEKAGADMLELNVSYAIPPRAGMHLGSHRDLGWTKAIIKAVKAKTNVPVMVKLNAFLIAQELRDWAKACVEGGADAISITNGLPGFAGIDVETGVPLDAFVDVNGRVRGEIQTFSGPAIRPFSLAGVAIVDAAVEVPIQAIGGVSDWYSAVEYMMLGASMVQVGSAAIAYGHRLVRDLIRGLEQFMERKGYSSIQDFVGVTNKKYLVGEPLTSALSTERQPRRMIVEATLCNGCGRCLPPCETNNGRGAIKMIDGIAIIDDNICDKCNLCVLVCPQGAIRTEWEPGYLK